jgi:hypothetical protein
MSLFPNSGLMGLVVSTGLLSSGCGVATIFATGFSSFSGFSIERPEFGGYGEKRPVACTGAMVGNKLFETSAGFYSGSADLGAEASTGLAKGPGIEDEGATPNRPPVGVVKGTEAKSEP